MEKTSLLTWMGCFFVLLLMVGCTKKPTETTFDKEFTKILGLPSKTTLPSDALALLAKNDQEDRNSKESVEELKKLLISGKKPELDEMLDYRDSVRLEKVFLYKNQGKIITLDDKFNAGIVFIHGDTTTYKLAYEYFSEVAEKHPDSTIRKQAFNLSIAADHRIRSVRGDKVPKLIITKQ